MTSTVFKQEKVEVYAMIKVTLLSTTEKRRKLGIYYLLPFGSYHLAP